MALAPYFEIHNPSILHDLYNKKEIKDYKSLYEFCDFIDTREDCNDFRLISLQRLHLQFGDNLPKEVLDRIKETYLNFRYWMEEPGDDNMCFWSENHQLLFAVAEYTAASLYPNDVFTNDGKFGKDKIPYAIERIRHWLDLKFRTGFIEWHSHVYFAEDLAALMHIIDFSKDQELIKKATIITDLLFFDMALHSYQGNLATTHGRSYEKDKKIPRDSDLAPILSEAFGLTDVPYRLEHIQTLFMYRMNYKVPKIIIEIAKDTETRIVKDQNGFDAKEIKKELDFKNKLDRFVLWQCEMFTNPEIIEDSIDIMNEYDLYSNEFLADFKLIGHPLLRKLRVLPLISRILKTFIDGVAIQKANTYTYKTKDYSMSTAQSYHPGECGDQHHIMNVCFGESFNIFVTHPTKHSYDEDNAYLSLSPNEWVGNGRNPHSVQYENINISMFNVPKKPTFMEKVVLQYTHAYFPVKEFDDYEIDGNYAFMKYKNSHLALIGRNKLSLKNDDELIQEGRHTTWITEVGSSDQESFEEFKKRIKENKVMFTNKEVTYSTYGNLLCLKYKKNFTVNDEVIDMNHLRMDTPFCKTHRNTDEYKITYNDMCLTLNLQKMIRKED